MWVNICVVFLSHGSYLRSLTYLPKVCKSVVNVFRIFVSPSISPALEEVRDKKSEVRLQYWTMGNTQPSIAIYLCLIGSWAICVMSVGVVFQVSLIIS